MSAFSSNPFDEAVRRQREAATDALVARTRASTPPGVADQREQKRLSSSEMNAMDPDTIRERFLSTKRDDRGPVMRFLDLLDMPRAQAYAFVAPGLERKARERGNTGTFGTGKVHFSDLLGELGMKPGIIRAGLGLVGDIATDPLILLGPIGGGIKTVTAGGRAVESTVRGVRAVGRASKEAKAGRAISNPIVRAMADAAGSPTSLKAGLFGGAVRPNTLLGRTVQKAGKLTRETQPYEGGLIAKYADAVAPAGSKEATAIKAVQDFVQTYGRGTSPGIRIGRDATGKRAVELSAGGPGRVKDATSTYLHLPFTDIGVHGPAISGGARTAAGMLALNAANRIGMAAADSDRLTKAREARKAVASATDEWKAVLDQEKAFRQANPDSVARVEARGGDREYGLYGDVDPDRPTQEALSLFSARKAALSDQIKTAQDSLWNIHKAAETDLKPKGIGEVLALIKSSEEVEAGAAHAAAQANLLRHDLDVRGGILSGIKKREDDVLAPFERLADIDTKERGDRGPILRALLGQDAAGQSVINADPNAQRAAALAAKPALDEYEAATSALRQAEATGKADEANIARLAVEAAREKVYAATEPLRMNPSQTIDGLRESVRARELANLSASKLALANMADSDAKAMQELADAHHEAMKASIMLASATKGSVMQWLNQGQVGLLETARGFLGTSDPVQGAAAFAPMATALRAAFPKQADIAIELAERGGRYKRFLIGQREGSAADVARRAHRAMGPNSRLAAEQTYNRMEGAMRQVAKDHGIPASEIPELLDIVTALAYQIRAQQAGRQVAMGRSVGTIVPAGYLQRIDEAKAKGYLDPKLHNGLALKLRDIARQFPEMMDDLNRIETGAGVARGEREFHLSKVTTPLAERTIGEAKRNKFGGPQATQARNEALEQMQQGVTTDHAVFRSIVTGQDELVFDMDRWAQTLTPEQIESIADPAAREHAHRLKAVLDEYDAMPDRPSMMASDPEEMNQYIREGRFASMLGRPEFPGQFFETNMATIMAGRMGSHERAMARQFMADYRSSMFVPVNKGTIEKALNAGGGTIIDLGNGAQGRVVPLGGGVNGVRVGPDIFRPLRTEYANNLSNPVVKSLGLDGIEAFYPEKVAEAIERYASIHESEPIARELLTAMDKMTAAWKTVTLMHPSWFIFNMVGDTINFWMSDPKFPAAMAKYGPAAIKAAWLKNDPAAMAKANVNYTIDGQAVRHEDLSPLLSSSGITDANQLNEIGATLHREGFLSLPSMHGGMGDSIKPGGFRPDFEEALRFQAAAGRSGKGAKARAGSMVVRNRAGRWFYGPWFRFNQQAADVLRTVAYLSYRDQGLDHAAASYKTLRAGFDYSDMTRVERDVFKRMLPFYSFLRNNGAYQVRTLLARPMYAGSFPLIQKAIEEAVSGEEQIPMHARPGWMKEQLAIMVGNDKDDRMALTLGTALPQEQAFVLGRLLGGQQGLQDFGNYFLSSLNPLVRAPLEIAAGKEFFSDRTIGGDPMMSDMTPAKVLTNQVRPFREIPKLVETFQKQGVGPGASRALLGGRSQPASDERLRIARLREFREENERLRRAIITAGYRSGAPVNSPEFNAASIRPRVAQLQLFQAMQQAGLDSEIPVWAREQLATLSR